MRCAEGRVLHGVEEFRFRESVAEMLNRVEMLSPLERGGPRCPAMKIDEDVAEVIARHDSTVMAGGHTHTQMLRPNGDVLVVNPGSIGAPKCPPWAEYAVVTLDYGRLQVDFHRLRMDVDAVIEAARVSGMPNVDWWAQDRTGRTFDDG